MQEELAEQGLTIIAVAIDSDLEAVREWAAHAPGLTIVIDRDYTVAEQYGIVNVPATVWIDENGRIVRPADTAMADDRFRAFAHVDSSVHHAQLRAWVNDGVLDLDEATVAELMERPSPELQQARLHRRIAVELHDRGDVEAAREHLASAVELAPNDWVIRRGSMPMNDIDPFGEKFFEFVGEWMEAGSPGYRLATGREYPGDRPHE
ncbi:MAG: Redoxin domain protein [Acidimicrobiales bacterium]|nr:Redoxin domain protein [Acidimicrobiales bacterium]